MNKKESLICEEVLKSVQFKRNMTKGKKPEIQQDLTPYSPPSVLFMHSKSQLYTCNDLQPEAATGTCSSPLRGILTSREGGVGR